jgi:hypothetical protein
MSLLVIGQVHVDKSDGSLAGLARLSWCGIFVPLSISLEKKFIDATHLILRAVSDCAFTTV